MTAPGSSCADVKPEGAAVPARPGADPAADLRERVLAHLEAQGFKIGGGGVLAPVQTDKNRIRQLHDEAVAAQRERVRPALARHESRLLARLADPTTIDVGAITPKLVLVDDRRSVDGLTWRWCAQHWSIPVSAGYGRRLRFLVLDSEHGDSLMGVIGLADPVFALNARDNHIGWTRADRVSRLACVMDAFVLGAAPPYGDLIGGKLIALLAGSTQVRDIFDARYGHRQTLIADRDPDAHLALITTASALGRSSVYNRLRRRSGALALEPAGYTRGSGDFHFSGGIYDDLAEFALSLPVTRSHRHPIWTGGRFRNRREVIQRSLDALGLDSRSLRVHGVQRQVFLQPLAGNTYSWLRGEDTELQWQTEHVDALSQWWKERWAINRAERNPTWRAFDREQWRLFDGGLSS